MKRFVKLFIFSVAFIGLPLLIMSPALAESPKYLDNLKTFANKAGFDNSQTDSDAVAKTIGRMASVVISFVGLIFIIICVYSGIQWMTAGGNEERVKEARTRIIRAFAGLILIAISFVLTNLLTSRL